MKDLRSPSLIALLALVGSAAASFVPPARRTRHQTAAVTAVRRSQTIQLLSQRDDGGDGDRTSTESSMPKRWAALHECERPARWREKYDAEDCKIYGEFGQDAVEGRVSTTIGSSIGKPRKYTDIVQTLNTTEDLLRVAAQSSGEARLIVVKFYSKKCRMCYRIAAKYRRLALDYESDIDCYEAASDDARGLFEALNVTAVPSIQIFDGRKVTRLASYAAKPQEWRKLLGKVNTAMRSIKARRSIHEVFGTALIDDLQDHAA